VVNINELPLTTRLEAANEEFSRRYYRRMDMARSGTRPYPSQDLYKDLYTCAGNQGLFAIALWAYFWKLRKDTKEDEWQRKVGVLGMGDLKTLEIIQKRAILLSSRASLGWNARECSHFLDEAIPYLLHRIEELEKENERLHEELEGFRRVTLEEYNQPHSPGPNA
jgi:hypothetical protein